MGKAIYTSQRDIIRFLILMLVIVITIAACDSVGVSEIGLKGSGTVITEDRDVRGFDSVRLLGIGKLRITVSGEESLVIEAEDNLMPLLTSTVNNGVLELGIKEARILTPTKDVIYTIHVSELKSVELGGAGSIDVEKLDAQIFSASILGAGDITLHGQAEELTVNVAGTGNYLGYDLTSGTATVTIAGTGSAEVNASDALNVTIAGTGNVTYMGDATVSNTILGTGSVNKR